MFEYYNNVLCVHGKWLYKEGGIIDKSDYHHLIQKSWIKLMRKEHFGCPALVAYESLPECFREGIVERYGDPYQSTPSNRFEDMLVWDTEAQSYYKNYQLETGAKLPEKTIKEYVANATVLNGIEKCLSKTKEEKKKTKAMWAYILDDIHCLSKEQFPHSLPKNLRSLKRKYTAYTDKAQHNYKSLIHGGFCNDNSEKLTVEAKLWVISRWADRVSKCSGLRQLLGEYNQIASQKKWKPLKEEQTLYNYLYKENIKHLWYGHRYGDAASKEKFAYQHSTKLPTMRDSLWYSDGTKLNYYYQYTNELGELKTGTCQVYEVMDAYSEFLLGYHISNTENYEAQYYAYKMAMQTASHRPYQLGFDGQGGHKKLKAGSFLNKLSRLAIRTAPYNGKSKTIESAFGRLQTQFLKQDWFFTGQNITAHKKESKSNMEFIQANRKSLPTLEEITVLYQQRRKEWNDAKHPISGLSRSEMYFNSCNPEAPKIDTWDMVDLFWLLREKPVRCNAYGIAFQEKKQKYQYMVYQKDGLPDVNWLRSHIDKKFYIKYDPEDMSEIYLYEKTPLGLRFVTEAQTKIEIHRGKQEQEAWEANFIQQVRKLNEQTRQSADDKMDEMLEEMGRLPEQYGLKSPSLLGIKNKTKKATNRIGELQKKESNRLSDTSLFLDENLTKPESEEAFNIYSLISKTTQKRNE